MDEFAMQKGHRYATVIVEPTRSGCCGSAGAGTEESARSSSCSAERARLRAAVMDMNDGLRAGDRQHCPNAVVVFDLFHVVAKYGREVIDRVRVDEANRLHDDRPGRKVVKVPAGCCCATATRTARARTCNSRSCSPPTRSSSWSTCCAMSSSTCGDTASRRRRSAPGTVVPAGAAQPHRALEALRPTTEALSARHPGTLSLAAEYQPRRRHQQQDQGHQAMAYGFRDEEYFFLKIRAAFPGIAR